MAGVQDALEPIAEVLDRRLVAMLLGGIMCLGMALGLEVYPHFSGRGMRPPVLAANEERLLEPLQLPEAPAPRGSLTFAELIGLLSPRRADAAGARFAQAFGARSSLKRIYDQFASGPANRPALDFVAALQRSPEFGDLVRAQARSPDFRAVAAMVTRQPEVNRLLHALKRPGTVSAPVLPEFAPAGTGADTVGAEFLGRNTPSGPVHAPGRPVETPAPDR